ncbi:hypothetical protein BH10PSE7_BH10PSE7_39400 [soil metagenome]
MKRALPLLILLASVLPAGAADYPYSGVLVLAAQDGENRNVDLARCAFGFFIQTKAGIYANYHIDLPAFKANKTLRYLKYGEGTCAYDPAANTEACAVSWSTESGPLATYYDVIQSIAPDEVRTREFPGDEDLKKWVATKDDELGYPVRYLTCPFSAEKIAPFLTDERTTLAREDLDKIVGEIPSTDDQAVMKDVYMALGVAWPRP